MTSIEFVKSELKHIRKTIKNISLTYMYEDTIEYHTIIVQPADKYRDDEEYKKLENKIVWDFYDKFPNEDILFSENVPHISINNVLIELKSFEFDWSDKPTNNFKFTIPNNKQNTLPNYVLAA